jgi:hypothetical protein
MKAKKLTPQKIDQIHIMLDESKTHAEIMRTLDVSLRRVTYQVSFRPKNITISSLAKKVGLTLNAIYKRRQKGMTLEQAVTHKKWVRYEHPRI